MSGAPRREFDDTLSEEESRLEACDCGAPQAISSPEWVDALAMDAVSEDVPSALSEQIEMDLSGEDRLVEDTPQSEAAARDLASEFEVATSPTRASGGSAPRQGSSSASTPRQQPSGARPTPSNRGAARPPTPQTSGSRPSGGATAQTRSPASGATGTGSNTSTRPSTSAQRPAGSTAGAQRPAGSTAGAQRPAGSTAGAQQPAGSTAGAQGQTASSAGPAGGGRRDTAGGFNLSGVFDTVRQVSDLTGQVTSGIAALTQPLRDLGVTGSPSSTTAQPTALSTPAPVGTTEPAVPNAAEPLPSQSLAGTAEPMQPPAALPTQPVGQLHSMDPLQSVTPPPSAAPAVTNATLASQPPMVSSVQGQVSIPTASAIAQGTAPAGAPFVGQSTLPQQPSQQWPMPYPMAPAPFAPQVLMVPPGWGGVQYLPMQGWPPQLQFAASPGLQPAGMPNAPIIGMPSPPPMAGAANPASAVLGMHQNQAPSALPTAASLPSWLQALQTGQLGPAAALGPAAVPAAAFNVPAGSGPASTGARDATALLSLILSNPALQQTLQQAPHRGRPAFVNLAMSGGASPQQSNVVPLPLGDVLQTIATLSARSMLEQREDWSTEETARFGSEHAEYMLSESGDFSIDPDDAEQRVELVGRCFARAAAAGGATGFEAVAPEPPSPQGPTASPNPARGQSDASATSLLLPQGFQLGVWIDVGARNFRQNLTDHLDSLVELQFTDVCFMVNSQPSPETRFSLSSFPIDELRRLVPELRRRNVRVALTSWITPRRQYLDELISQLPGWARELQVAAIEFDAEEAWTRTLTSGFSDHDQAADYLFDGMSALRSSGIAVGVTAQVDPLPSVRLRRLVERADFIVPQAYSSMNREWLATTESRQAHAADIRSHALGGPYGPVGIQQHALERLRAAVMAPKPTILGLAAYYRDRWAGHRAADVMHSELAQAIRMARNEACIQGVRYWSWKWIRGMDGRQGSPANRYAYEFLRGLGRETAIVTRPRAASRAPTLEPVIEAYEANPW